jgi:stage IV sporulation protein FB
MTYARGFDEVLIILLSYLVHELFHVVTSFFVGFKLDSLAITLFGMRMNYQETGVPPQSAALLFLAGPLGNLLFFVSVLVVSASAYVPDAEFFLFYNLLLFMVNMIPAYPMDAARAIEAFLRIRRSELESVKIVAYISYLVAISLFSIGLYLFIFKTNNFLLMLLSIFIMSSTKKALLNSEMDALFRIKNKLNL